jgi:hypothetical protein
MERPNRRTRSGVLPLATLLGGGGVIATFVGFVFLALTISPLCIDDRCGEAGTVGEFATSVALLITGGLGIAAAIVGVRYARSGEGAFGTISAIAAGAAVVTAMLFAAAAR